MLDRPLNVFLRWWACKKLFTKALWSLLYAYLVGVRRKYYEALVLDNSTLVIVTIIFVIAVIFFRLWGRQELIIGRLQLACVMILMYGRASEQLSITVGNMWAVSQRMKQSLLCLHGRVLLEKAHLRPVDIACTSIPGSALTIGVLISRSMHITACGLSSLKQLAQLTLRQWLWLAVIMTLQPGVLEWS